MKDFYLLVVSDSVFKPLMRRGLAYKVNKFLLQPLSYETMRDGFNVTFSPRNHRLLTRKYEL